MMPTKYIIIKPITKGLTALSMGWPNHKPIRNESSMTVPPMTDIGFVCTFYS